MVLLLGAWAVLMAGYVCIGRMNTTATVAETQVTVPLWQEGKTVSALSWTQDGEHLSFSLGESVWMKEDDAAFPVNQSALGSLAGKISGLTAVRELTDVTRPEDYGLDAPAFSVAAKDEDGDETVYALGGKDEETDRYARLPDSRMVYTFYSGDADDLLEAGIDTLWQRKPVSVTADELSEAAFAWDGGEAVLTAQDGESATMQSVVELLNDLEGTERVALEEPGEEVLSVRLTQEDGETQTLVFETYNVDSYLLDITDSHGMLVPAQDVDRLIRMLRQKG